MSDVTNNRLRNAELGKFKSREGDSIRQLGLKFNLNNEIILTEYDPLDGGDTFTGLVWDRDNRTLKLQLPEGEVFLGGSEGVTTASISEIIEGSKDVGNLVRFVEDIDSLQTSSLHESIKMAVVGDTLLTKPGDQAYLYAWNENSSLPHSPPSVVKPDSVENFELGRWEIATSIPLDLDKVLITVDTSSDLENYPRPQSRQQAIIFESDGNNPSGLYIWDSDSTTDGSGYITPNSQESSQTGRWIRSNNSFLVESNNLSDLENVSNARSNLGLGEVALRDDNEVLLSNNNLSDVDNTTSSRNNLGLGTAATQDSSEILQVNNSLSEISSLSSQNLARQNIGMPGRDASNFNDAGAGVYRESYFLHAKEQDTAEEKITFAKGLDATDIDADSVTLDDLNITNSINTPFDLNADLLEGKPKEFYTNLKNFYENPPEGERIYVSARSGDDINYGYTPDNPVKTIKQAAINAFALQAPSTLEGNIQRDAFQVFQWNRSQIVEEMGKVAKAHLSECDRIDPRTYRDIDDFYNALSKDLLLGGNRNFRNALRKIADVGSTVYSAWDTLMSGVSPDLTLFDALKYLMKEVLDPNITTSQITQDYTFDNYTPDIQYSDKLRTDSGKENLCDFLGNNIDGFEFPSNLPSLDEVPLVRPNQLNRSPYTVIRVESGEYFEDFPIELPDQVTVFGDSLRRVTIQPKVEVKEKGAGLHSRILGDTFTFLSLESTSVTWTTSLTFNYQKSSGSTPAVVSVFSGLDFESGEEEFTSNLEGRLFKFSYSDNFRNIDAYGEIRSASLVDSSSETKVRLEFADGTHHNIDQIPPGNTITVTDDTNGEQSDEALSWSDIYDGYLLYKGFDGNGQQKPISVDGNHNFPRGQVLTPNVKFTDLNIDLKLRKGDVLAVYNSSSLYKEPLRVEKHEETDSGDISRTVTTIPHRLNGELTFHSTDNLVYIAPRAEWQTQCEPRLFEENFSDNAQSYPSFITETDPLKVGQHAFLVGNANYVFQVNFKEHTNFSFAFRRDNPRILASPYIQNCSSISTKGAGGILVDGFLPKQPDDDFPKSLSDEPSVYSGLNEPHKLLINLHYDGVSLIRTYRNLVLDLFDTQTIQDILDNLSSDTNYDNQIEKCKRDANHLLDAITWQMLRGGNDKVYDTAVVIRKAIYRQVDGDSTYLQEVADAYNNILDEIFNKLSDIIKGVGVDIGGIPEDTEDLCSNVVSTISNYIDFIKSIISNGEGSVTRTNHIATPSLTLNQEQNAELRSFVLDAFTQINTFGGIGHLIRRNGYAQLVSTFTTFCDHGVRVESGGLINLSNSVSDFGFFGLLSDGYSENPYLVGKTLRQERAALPGNTPRSEIILDPLSFDFNPSNLVYESRANGELASAIQNYKDKFDSYKQIIDNGNTPTESDKEEVEEARVQLESIFSDEIQFNSSILFKDKGEGIYDFYRDGTHLSTQKQIPRSVSFVDRREDTSEDALRGYPRITQQLDVSENLQLIRPSVRVGFTIASRIPNFEDIGTGRDESSNPILEAGTGVDIYITTTLTSSAHGFEYVGSGNDYTNALPENGGIPDSSKQLLPTNGGKIFTSSTDVQGDFRVGNFFTVEQSTGSVRFSPSSLELINITSIGPFRNNGIVGRDVIRDLTNDFRDISEGGLRLEESTVATVAAIRRGIDQRLQSLEDKVINTLDQALANSKLLEAIRNPIPDYGSWASRYSIYHRPHQLNSSYNIDAVEITTEAIWADVRNMDAFLYDYGGRYSYFNSGGTNEFVNRSSFTINFVIDSSESMSQSGQFWQIKEDLIKFFYNASDNDSFAIYTFSDSSSRRVNIVVESANIVDSFNEGETVSIYAPNNEGSRVVAYYDIDELNNWYNDTLDVGGNTYQKVAEAKVYNRLSKENKVQLEAVKGYINSGLVVFFNNGTATINNIEIGLTPDIFSSSEGISAIQRNDPNFDPARALKNSLLKRVGVVFPTTDKTGYSYSNADQTLEALVWNRLENETYFSVNSVTLNSSKGPFIAPASDDYTSDTNKVWETWSDSNDFRGVNSADFNDTNLDFQEANWFYSDNFPNGSSDIRITSPFQLLPPRTSRNNLSYDADELDTFYHQDSNHLQGFLVDTDFESGNWLKEQQSTPELDIALTIHRWGMTYASTNSIVRYARGLMQDLDDINLFDWKVAKYSEETSITRPKNVRDFYLDNVEESPRREIFSGRNEFFKGADRSYQVGLTDAQLELNDSIGFASDSSGSPGTFSGNTSSIEGDTTFWIELNWDPVIHQGSIFELRARDPTANVDLSSFTLNESISSLVVNSSQLRLEAGDTIEIRYETPNLSSDDRAYISFRVTFTLTETLEPSGGTVGVEGTGTGWDRIAEAMGYSDPSNITSNEGDPIRTGSGLTLDDSNRSSGEIHPLFDYTLDYETTYDENGDPIGQETVSYRFFSRGIEEEQAISLRVLDVNYKTAQNNSRIQVTTDLDSPNSRVPYQNSGDWILPGGNNKTFGYTSSRISIPTGETLYYKGYLRRLNSNRSSFSPISESCLELSWRPNSLKVLIVNSRQNFRKDKVEYGGYYYAQNSSLSLTNRFRLRRFDKVVNKYWRNLGSPQSYMDGAAIESVLNRLFDEEDTSLVFPTNLYSNSDFPNFLDTICDELRLQGAMQTSWYLGGIWDESGNVLEEQLVSAQPGTVNKYGRLIFKDKDSGVLLTPDIYTSYLACQEDLIFADIDQIHLETRPELYWDTEGYQNDIFAIDDLFDPNNPDIKLGGLLSIHNPVNFSDSIVRSILEHRAGASSEDEFDPISRTDGYSGAGVPNNSYDSADIGSTHFNQNWEDSQIALPDGRWNNWFQVRRTSWIKDLLGDILEVIGEGSGTLYSEFGNDSGEFSTENQAEVPPGYREFIANPDYIDSDGLLYKNPTPRLLPTPSIDKGLAINAPNSDISPGMTLKGKSAIYEAFASAVIDQSNREESLINRGMAGGSSVHIPRNQARQGTVNLTCIISDGLDNTSFDNLIYRGYIPYDRNNRVDKSLLLRNVFLELFLDEVGNIQFDSNGVPVQQKFIYTSELINSLYILAYAQTQDKTSVRVDNLGGYGSDENSYDLPFYIGTGSIYPDRGVRSKVRSMVNPIDNPFSLQDGMGLVIPFYRGTNDAEPYLVYANDLLDNSLSNNSLFPNPYRFTAYSFKAKDSKQAISLQNLSDRATIYTSLGEQGPDIGFEIDTTQLDLSDFIYSNESSVERNVEFPERIGITLYSKLGYLHSIIPNVESQTVSSKIAILDTGFGQQVSANSLILAQNLGGSQGTPFVAPDRVVVNDRNSGDIVNRDVNNLPTYTQNPEGNLIEQRQNYIENAFRSTAVNSGEVITAGYPLISRRYVGTQETGERLGSIAYVNSNIYLTKRDSNGNNRNVIYRLDSGTATWEPLADTSLRTGGTRQYVKSFTVIEFNGGPSPTAIIIDPDKDRSRILVFSNNVWQVLVDSESTIYDPITGQESPLNLEAQETIESIQQVTDKDGNLTTHILISGNSGGRLISTKDTLNSINLNTESIVWTVTSYEPTFVANSKNELDFYFTEESGEPVLENGDIFYYDNPNSSDLKGIYKFDTDYDLNWGVYYDDKFVADESNPPSDVSNGVYLPLASVRGDAFNSGKVRRVQDWDTSELPPNEGGEASRYVETVLHNNAVDEEDLSDIYFYDHSEGGSNWKSLSSVVDGIDNRGKGVWSRLTQFDASETINGGTGLSDFSLSTGQYLYNSLVLDSTTSSDPHVFIIKKDDENPNYSLPYVAEISGLLSSTIRSTWVSLGEETYEWNESEEDSFLTEHFSSNRPLPSSASLLSNFETANQIYAVFNDRSLSSEEFYDLDSNGNRQSDGNGSYLTSTYGGNVIFQRSSTLDIGESWQLLDEFNSNAYIERAFSISRGDDFVVILRNPSTDDLDVRLYTISSGSIDTTTDVYSLTNKPDTLIEGATLIPQSSIPSGLSMSGGDILLLSVSSKSDHRSYVIVVNLSDTTDTTKLTETTDGSEILFRPLIDPSVYPRYPHNENWIRDGLVGINEGRFLASNLVNGSESDFKWNALRYNQDDLYTSLTETLRNYRSQI